MAAGPLPNGMIGVIQGRLTQPMNGKIQGFPWGFWEKEFEIARDIGIDCIGWIFEENKWQENPLWTPDGREKVKRVMSETGVRIEYLCADYFMEHPFIRVSTEECHHTRDMLREVMQRSAELGIKGIEIPMVDNSRIDTEEERVSIVRTLKQCIPLMEKLHMELSIESSLEPTKLKDMLEDLDHPLFCITYDIGNSASLGYDTAEEIRTFGKWIHNVHVKDRLLHGTTVPLGSGNADFDKTFDALLTIRYTGPFTLQAAREGDPVENTKKQLLFLRKYIDANLQFYVSK